MAREQPKQGKKNRKYGRNAEKCKRYRTRIGKPNGPGQPGNKAGKKRSAPHPRSND